MTFGLFEKMMLGIGCVVVFGVVGWAVWHSLTCSLCRWYSKKIKDDSSRRPNDGSR